jgi:hypothetical protein
MRIITWRKIDVEVATFVQRGGPDAPIMSMVMSKIEDLALNLSVDAI